MNLSPKIEKELEDGVWEEISCLQVRNFGSHGRTSCGSKKLYIRAGLFETESIRRIFYIDSRDKDALVFYRDKKIDDKDFMFINIKE